MSYGAMQSRAERHNLLQEQEELVIVVVKKEMVVVPMCEKQVMNKRNSSGKEEVGGVG